MAKQVRLVKTGDTTRVEVDGVDMTRSLTRWTVTVPPGAESQVDLSGPDWSYVGPAEVTMQYEQSSKPTRPTAPDLITGEPAVSEAVTVPRSMLIGPAPVNPAAVIADEINRAGISSFLVNPPDPDIHVPVSSLSPAHTDPR